MSIHTADELKELMGIPFSDEQIKAIAAPLEPGVIIAGAGTGKTTVMAARVVWLVGTGQVEADEVLGLTFTNKAAGELGERIRGALLSSGVVAEGADVGTELVSTYDAFAAMVVRDFGLRGGIDDELRLVQGKAASFRLVDQVVRAAEGPLTSLSRLSHTTIPERVLKLDAELQSHLVSIAEAADFTRQARLSFENAPGQKRRPHAPYKAMLDAAETSSERLELLGLVDDYQALKAELGVIEFADQLRIAERLVREVPSVGRELRQRFKVVLLDEYQDTSAAQTKLLSQLFSGHAVTAVGDPYQAIYGWRGAAADNIHAFRREFGDGRRFELSINRRSVTSVLDVGNALASSIPGEGVSLRAPDGKHEGIVEAHAFTTDEEELSFLTQRILELGGQGSWGSIAVLCRNNRLLGEVFAELRAAGIPAEIVGLGGLLQLPEIVPVVATLRVLADPMDNPALATLLTGPRLRLSLADVEKLGRQARQLAQDPDEARDDGLAAALARTLERPDPATGVCLMDACVQPPEDLSDDARHRVDAFVKEMARLQEHRSEPLADLAQRIIRVLGVEEELLARGLDTAQLGRFVAECAAFDPIGETATLGGLIDYFQAEIAHDEGLQQALVSVDDSVKLMTVHKSKGLEWDIVFLPSLMEGTFPSSKSDGLWPTSAELLPAPLRGDVASIPQLEEYTKESLELYKDEAKEAGGYAEDRLAYVAATRARAHLVGSRHVWSAGAKRPKAPSRYFERLRERASKQQRAYDLVVEHEKNPLPDTAAAAPWPSGDEATGIQRSAAELVAMAGGRDDEWVTASASLSPEDAQAFETWDRAAAHILEQRDRARDRAVRVPEGLSATALMQLQSDPNAFAEQLVRPMPRKPSQGAQLGSRFHDWVQRRFELPGTFEEFERSRDPGLARLIHAFEAGRFATRAPIACEVPFSMARPPLQLRGRIDAVYTWDGDEFDEVVIDWKTSDAPANEVQLAVYRQAWAEARGLAPERVGAAFYHVGSDELVFVRADAALIEMAWPWE